MDPETFDILHSGIKAQLESVESIVKDYEKELVGAQLHQILFLHKTDRALDWSCQPYFLFGS